MLSRKTSTNRSVAGGDSEERAQPAATDRQLAIEIRPGRTLLVLIALIVLLIAGNAISLLVQPLLEAGDRGGLLELAYRFDFDRENTVPAWLSSLGLLAAGVLLLFTAHATGQRRQSGALAWALLGLAFAYLALDESIFLHELLISPVRRVLHAGGAFYFAWVIPAFAVVAVFGLRYVPFLLRLPRRTRWLFVASAVLYVGGALGMELIGGALAEQDGLKSARYLSVMTLEESLEMLGVALFIFSLLDHLRREFGRGRLRFVLLEHSQSSNAVPSNFSTDAAPDERSLHRQFNELLELAANGRTGDDARHAETVVGSHGDHDNTVGAT